MVHQGSMDLALNPSNTTTTSPPKVREQVLATIERGNVASKNVLLKAGFESFEWMNQEELIYFRKVLPIENPQVYRYKYFKE